MMLLIFGGSKVIVYTYNSRILTKYMYMNFITLVLYVAVTADYWSDITGQLVKYNNNV